MCFCTFPPFLPVFSTFPFAMSASSALNYLKHFVHRPSFLCYLRRISNIENSSYYSIGKIFLAFFERDEISNTHASGSRRKENYGWTTFTLNLGFFLSTTFLALPFNGKISVRFFVFIYFIFGFTL